jgi:hypothetical protein
MENPLSLPCVATGVGNGPTDPGGIEGTANGDIESKFNGAASAHQAGLSIRKIAGATGLSSSGIHQLLNAPEGKFSVPLLLVTQIGNLIPSSGLRSIATDSP